MLKTCQIAVSKPNIETACGASEVPDLAVSKPNRNSSWGLGRAHGKAAKGRRKLLGGF